ncbi:hemolysin III family protein [Chloroflexota bacterium]
MNQIKIQRQELFSFYSHLCGAIIVLVAAMALVYQARSCLPLVTVSIIYGLSAIFMLLSSALYHAFKKEENQANFLRKMDHFAIFCMIAGTYTPLCYTYLEGYLQWGIIIAQWVLVIASFFLKVFYIRAPRIFATVIYLLMGWMAIIPIKQILSVLPVDSIILLLLGGLVYSTGAVIYMLKKPNPIPNFFGFHEIFHLFILFGVFLHLPVIYLAVINAC